jgi:hypothetical protein
VYFLGLGSWGRVRVSLSFGTNTKGWVGSCHLQGQERFASWLSNQIHSSLVTIDLFADNIRFITNVYVFPSKD